MRSFFLLSTAAALAFATPVPQQLDLSMADAIPTPENVTLPSDVSSQTVEFDIDAALEDAIVAVLTDDNTIDVSDSTADPINGTTPIQKRAACSTVALGSGPTPSPDTAADFLKLASISTAANGASAPSGYTESFKNVKAAANAYGYLGFTTLTSYNVQTCADKCDKINGCNSINIYFERDPQTDPGNAECKNNNPASTTNIKCIFWGGPVTTENSVNAGQWRSKFQVVIAGANGYVKNSIATPTGYSSSAYYGAASIDAPKDCNGQSTFITSKVFTGSPFDARLCATACDAQNIDHAKTGAQQCRYFNTYILSRNNVALGQYCNLFTQAWTASQATYKGITSGANKYTISYSFGVSASSDAGNCNKESSPPTSDTGKPPVTGPSTGADGFINWKTFKANGVNLGSWLEKEKNHDTFWWNSINDDPSIMDEWSLCASLGAQCGPVFEARYGSYVTKADIDKLGAVGVNTLRIPTTYAAWVKVPGSQLYSGQQKTYLKAITDYAIKTYGMHVIIGLHSNLAHTSISLPGGINNLDIGEAFFHKEWFYSETNLAYSYQAIDGILDFIKASGNLTAWTIAPINEAGDDLSKFGGPNTLSTAAADWTGKYLNGCLDHIAKLDKRIPMMVQDSFMTPGAWYKYFDASANVVIDTHVYFFAVAGAYSQYTPGAVCGQAKWISNFDKFPNFVGEWSLQIRFNNTFSDRENNFNVQRFAFDKYASGGAFWNVHSHSAAAVSGEGTQRDYWSYVDLIDQGVVKTIDPSYAGCDAL
ncbi:glycoside hydrolase [Aureobasidium pullulans]|uniref:Glycoside hydrolase n=1 Tax=Aureobasidium pullulans TaxID=5580 RepID=A0AB38LMG7_AURPU|nr:glycoside hydrolase [Aureobasidium pullulans]THY69987.1 glycoside hydrolase [Aureobasidium pullulans]THZ38194.1 glycoside hydrolase [Aureobasidium pullulans]